MSEVRIDRRDQSVEFTRPSEDKSIMSEDDGLDRLYVEIVEGVFVVSMLDNGAGGEYTRSWHDIVLDREAALELRGFIDAWLDSPVSLN